MVLNKKKSSQIILLVYFGIIFCLFSCSDFKKNETHQQISDENIVKGKILASTYCKSCHLLPDPSLLDTKNWENGVLPAMGAHLGIFYYGFKEYPNSRNDRNLGPNFYPAKQVLSFLDWQNIMDYYTALSPDSLPGQQRKYEVESNPNLFNVAFPLPQNKLPTTCLVKIDTSIVPNQLLIADVMSKQLYRFDNNLLLLDSIKTISPVVDIEIGKQNIITCDIGIMNPNNGKYGGAECININNKGKMQVDTSFKINQLARPVQITSADFNNDGKIDYLLCEFGNLVGALTWMENKGAGKYEQHIIRNVPGAIKAYVQDVNHDGLPDIWVLFAQGDEGIFLFTNKGNGKFEQKEVLRFPPIYGSSYFELDDFNKDGYPDILYTCGDNADYSPALKPYHGVYIFLNDGKNNFTQKYFFPMYGCFKAIARDFDGDGDLDIAAISFFADYIHHPQESFIYLENKGNFDFKPYSIPGTTTGRWLTMDAGDINGDGKTDLVLGNFSVAPSSIKSPIDWKKGPPFIVLKNSIKR